MCLHMNVCSALFTVHNRVNNDHDIAVQPGIFTILVLHIAFWFWQYKTYQ